ATGHPVSTQSARLTYHGVAPRCQCKHHAQVDRGGRGGSPIPIPTSSYDRSGSVDTDFHGAARTTRKGVVASVQDFTMPAQIVDDDAPTRESHIHTRHSRGP